MSAKSRTPGGTIADRKKQIFSAMLPGLRATDGARSLLEYLSERHMELIVATSADNREIPFAPPDKRASTTSFRHDDKRRCVGVEARSDIVHAARSWARPEQVLLIGYGTMSKLRTVLVSVPLRFGAVGTGPTAA